MEKGEKTTKGEERREREMLEEDTDTSREGEGEEMGGKVGRIEAE